MNEPQILKKMHVSADKYMRGAFIPKNLEVVNCIGDLVKVRYVTYVEFDAGFIVEQYYSRNQATNATTSLTKLRAIEGFEEGDIHEVWERAFPSSFNRN